MLLGLFNIHNWTEFGGLHLETQMGVSLVAHEEERSVSGPWLNHGNKAISGSAGLKLEDTSWSLSGLLLVSRRG